MIKKKKKLEKKAPIEKFSKEEMFNIEWVEIDSIFEWEDNPRFNEDASAKLSEIIREHGIKSPIVCWDKNRMIYKGNTTWKACKILGMKKVPVIFHHFSSESSAKAYGIADNKGGEFAEWDEDLLLDIMSTKEFKKVKRNTGFSDREVELLEHWPPKTEEKEKAQKTGKDLKFRISLEVGADEYQMARESVKIWAEEFETVVVR